MMGTTRRECVDHVVALGEQHLRRVLKSYAGYYNSARTHRSLNMDAPVPRLVQKIGRIVSCAMAGGLHPNMVESKFSAGTTVLAASLRIGRASNGLSDIGVGDLVAAWGFGSTGSGPNVDRIAAPAGHARPTTTAALELDEAGRRARKRAPLSLDLSGIAKGFGVDEMARLPENRRRSFLPASSRARHLRLRGEWPLRFCGPRRACIVIS